MLNDLKELTQLCGISGDEFEVCKWLNDKIATFPDIADMHTDAVGNLIVTKKGTRPANHKTLIGAHMDEVGMIVTDVLSNGKCTIAPVGGIDADAVIGRTVCIPFVGYGVIGTMPVHHLSDEQKNKKPEWKDLLLDIGTRSVDEVTKYLTPGCAVCLYGEWTELGGGRVTAKAIDDRFGCAAMLEMLRGEIPYDTTFAFFTQEEIGLRGSVTAAYAVDPEFALILEATTAADLDGVSGGDAVCRLGGGPVVSFMDRRTMYDRELYRLAFAEAQQLGIPCQTKTRIAGGNDAGSVHVTRNGVRTLALSIPCRCLHTPSCTAQISDMEQTLLLTRRMMERIQEL